MSENEASPAKLSPIITRRIADLETFKISDKDTNYFVVCVYLCKMAHIGYLTIAMPEPPASPLVLEEKVPPPPPEPPTPPLPP